MDILLPNSTMLLLIKRDRNRKITQVLLAMKKRGFGKGKWNGIGGKVNELDGETIEKATVRETYEEIGVKVNLKDLRKVADFEFFYPLNPSFAGQHVHIFISEKWVGEPIESEEMSPIWFTPTKFPFSDMWPDEKLWMPRVLAGEHLKGSFTFGEGDSITSHILNSVGSF